MINDQPSKKRIPLKVAFILASTALFSAVLIFLTVLTAQNGTHYLNHLPEAHRLRTLGKFFRQPTRNGSKKLQKLRKSSPPTGTKSVPLYDSEANLKPVGLRNPDRRCFFNSVVQFLYHDRTFRRILTRNIRSNERLAALSEFFAQMDASAPKSQLSAPIRTLLPDYLANGYEQDAAEALQNFLDDIEDPEITLQTRITVTNVLLDGSTQVSSTYDEPRRLIQLNIPLESSKPNSLQSLFELQFAEESIEASGSEAERVRVKVRTTTFLELPQTLLIQLVRQNFLNDGHKINDEIEASQFIQITGQDGKLAQYQLNGFIHHQGQSMDSGHYIAYLRQADNTVTLFNDVMIKFNADISKDKNFAYIYSYVRVN